MLILNFDFVLMTGAYSQYLKDSCKQHLALLGTWKLICANLLRICYGEAIRYGKTGVGLMDFGLYKHIRKGKGEAGIAVHGTPSHSYGVSVAI